MEAVRTTNSAPAPQAVLMGSDPNILGARSWAGSCEWSRDPGPDGFLGSDKAVARDAALALSARGCPGTRPGTRAGPVPGATPVRAGRGPAPEHPCRTAPTLRSRADVRRRALGDDRRVDQEGAMRVNVPPPSVRLARLRLQHAEAALQEIEARCRRADAGLRPELEHHRERCRHDCDELRAVIEDAHGAVPRL
jgi:hypothetical protein